MSGKAPEVKAVPERAKSRVVNVMELTGLAAIPYR
jgi:hypothetical protein